MGEALRTLAGLPAPAKINWFLHLLGRRDDGYHQLQTVFQFIDWADRIDLALRDDGRIERRGADELPADDLSVRAARLLQRASGSALGATITLHKSIPAQAGLGGGSSDAATTLLGLNRLWGLGWSRPQLLELALQLGADVPVFVDGRNAFAGGIGEQLTPVALPVWDLLVAWPGQGLSTAAVFASPLLRRDTPALEPAAFEAHLRQASTPSEGLAFGRNDLQPAAAAALSALQPLHDWLAQYGSPVRMSGSGSALFVPCAPGLQPQGADPAWRWRVCRALPGHPLRDI